MRKIFIALAASLLVTIGSAVRMIQIDTRDLTEGYHREHIDAREHRYALKHRDENWEGAEEGHHLEHEKAHKEEEHHEQKNAQGFLGLIEKTVNIGDEVAQTIDPAIPTVKLSNVGSTVTLKVAGKLAEAGSKFNFKNAFKKSVNNYLDSAPGSNAQTQSSAGSKFNFKNAFKKSVNNYLDSAPGSNAQTQSEGFLGLVEGAVNIGD
jgi:hypothetical protein